MNEVKDLYQGARIITEGEQRTVFHITLHPAATIVHFYEGDSVTANYLESAGWEMAA